jgi:hypothetical protein
MLQSRRVFKKWTENFYRSPLVRTQPKVYNRSIARQLFYGKNADDYDDKYPHGFQRFYFSVQSLTSSEIVETLLLYLDFVGIRLDRERVARYIEQKPGEVGVMVTRAHYLLKSFAHNDINVDHPFKENYGNVDFFVRIQTGQAQLPIFDEELFKVHSPGTIPDGYGDDAVVKKFFSAIESSNASFFISGKAGTGKSTFIRYFTLNTKKTVLLMAFTGIAAMNVGGTTIHSFFRFPLHPLVPGDEDIKIFDEDSHQRKLIASTDTIIIDEVSMLRADILQAIDHSLRHNGGDQSLPFGGKQILFVGDLFQLPPVADGDDETERYLFKHLYQSEYFFDCEAYRQLNPGLLEFTHSHRQGEDLEFVTLLDRVRVCDIDDELISKLNERVDEHYVPARGEFGIILASTNAVADAENGKRLVELSGNAYDFPAMVQGDFESKRVASGTILTLKQGAQVMFTKNDSLGHRWVNGTIGRVDFVAEDIIDIRLPDNQVYKLEREQWEHRTYKFDKVKNKVTSAVKGVFNQFPVKLAWAITIHKSQGLTFDRVIIDMGRGAFASGQLYTALSRCRKLSGIVLRRPIKRGDVIRDSRLIEFYERLQK